MLVVSSLAVVREALHGLFLPAPRRLSKFATAIVVLLVKYFAGWLGCAHGFAQDGPRSPLGIGAAGV
jgi:hypothetical protein